MLGWPKLANNLTLVCVATFLHTKHENMNICLSAFITSLKILCFNWYFFIFFQNYKRKRFFCNLL